MRTELISFRKSLGLNIEQMALKTQISKSFYEKIERVERNVSNNFVSNFRNTFPDTDVEYFSCTTGMSLL